MILPCSESQPIKISNPITRSLHLYEKGEAPNEALGDFEALMGPEYDAARFRA